MKKLKLLCVPMLAVSSFAFATDEGKEASSTEMAPIEQTVFYAGGGIGTAGVKFNHYGEDFSATTLMLQGGYKYNEYLAFEGRYLLGLSTDYDKGSNLSASSYDGNFSSWGIYVKPMYPVTKEFDVYGLLGFGGVMLSNLNDGDAYESTLQWGLGAQYSVTNNIAVFVDYVSLYDGTGFDYVGTKDDVSSDTWTIGLNYSF